MLAILISAAAGASDISTDRPSAGTSALTVGGGVFQIETGLQADSAAGTVFTVPTLLRYGIGEDLEFRADSGLVSLSGGSQAFGGLGAGAKYTALRTEVVSIGVLAGSGIPLDGAEASPYALALADFTAGAWANAGWTGGSALFYAAGYGVSLPFDGISAFIETAGSFDAGAGAWAGTLQTGLVWASGNCEADIYRQQSLDNTGASMTAAGVSYRFGAD